VQQFVETFLSWDDFRASILSVLRGFMTNLSLMFVAEACVLVWGLVLALLRSTRGAVLAPLRWLAIGYIDLFRAIPGLVLIYMVGFGIPIAGIPWVGRRVIPPLLNDFIGLQKDTAFIGIIGVIDGFRRAQIYAGTHFNLTSFTGLALCFVVVTFPMTRLTDRLLKRDQLRMAARR
jgi:polar amino acid transport system permease protein